ncbi:hypothetical protein KY320_01335, partial [Candidatus Woesearchaeota archaeon]|nr:hypothetical protein [Candidatus Woesearchaeota archaeon]
MAIIETICATGPSRAEPCMTIFGVRVQLFLVIIVFSLITGFGISNMLFRLKKISQRNVKKYGLMIFVLAF